MSIAYITYYDLVHGYGGAEGMDRDMISQAPEPVSVYNYVPDEDFDAIVVSGAFQLPEKHKLEGRNFLYWPHDAQDNDPRMYAWARRVVWTTPAHQLWGAQFRPKAHALNPSWFDTSMFVPGTKTKDLLWAHRLIWHKGLDQARDWARQHKAELTELHGVPREEVAAAMAIHRRFILLSDQIFDIAPRAVMEAQLSGCEIIVNANVGVWADTPDELRARVDRAAREFWELAFE